MWDDSSLFFCRLAQITQVSDLRFKVADKSDRHIRDLFDRKQLEAVQVGQQVVGFFLRENVLEGWHLAFSVLQDGTDLRVCFSRMRFAHNAMKAGSKANLIGNDRVTLEAILCKDLLAGMSRLLL